MFPVFVVIGLGFLLGRRMTLELRTLTDFVLYVAGPSLVFVALTEIPLARSDMALMAGATVVLMFGVGLIVKIGASFVGAEPGALYLPAMFFNAGNMLLPISVFAFGDEGLALAAVMTATANLAQHALAPAIASGGVAWKHAFRIPYGYAAILGLIVQLGDVTIPLFAARTVGLLADAATAYAAHAASRWAYD